MSSITVARFPKGTKSNGKATSIRPLDTESASTDSGTAELARLIAAYAPHDGSFELRVPGLHASRLSRVNTECFHTLRLPSLCIVVQGAKSVIVGKDVYQYDASRMIVFSVALPVASQVTQASQSAPYLGFKLDLDPHKIAELVLKVYPQGLPPSMRGLRFTWLRLT